MTQPKLACPFCGSYKSKVRDTQSTAAGIERRRRCEDCRKRFRTIETHRPVGRPTHPKTGAHP